jgi:hypothetical protein
MTLSLVSVSVLLKTDYTQITYTNNRTQTMTTEQQVQFENARTGYELLQVLEDIMTRGFSYIESPQLEQILGISTLVPMEF